MDNESGFFTTSLENNPFEDIQCRSLLMWLFITFIVTIILGAFLNVWAKLEDVASFVALLFLIYSAITTFIWVRIKFRKNEVEIKNIIGRYPKDFHFGLVIKLCLALWVLSVGILILQDILLKSFHLSILSKPGPSDSSFAYIPIWLIPVVLVVCAPIIEEFIFRGFLIHRWSYKWNLTKAIWFSSILFALFHNNIIGTLLFGLTMCILYLKYKTLILPIIVHALSNLFPALLILMTSLLNLESTVSESPSSEEPSTLALVIVAAIFLSLSAPFVIKFVVRNWPEKETVLPYFSNSTPISSY